MRGASVSGEQPACDEQHHESDQVGQADGERRLIEQYERHHQRKCRAHDQQENTEGAPEVAPAEAGPDRQGGLLEQPTAQQLQALAAGQCRKLQWQHLRNERLTGRGVRAIAQGHVQLDPARALDQCAQQVHDRIGQSPGEIAAERGNHHRAFGGLVCRGHADGAGERHGHQQAEDHLGNALDRVKYRRPLELSIGWHELTSSVRHRLFRLDIRIPVKCRLNGYTHAHTLSASRGVVHA
ncbi:hypothetical protein D3C84_195930 [compost metagenome]